MPPLLLDRGHGRLPGLEQKYHQENTNSWILRHQNASQWLRTERNAIADATRAHVWGNTATYEAYMGRWSR